MDWINSLNNALGYIEKNLDGEINYTEIGLITVCPISLFQRFFMLSTGITLSEYICRRKLTCALQDLKSTDMKVIDIALKYGYDSSDAFCVAFKRLYGITPSTARLSDIKLKKYYRIFFALSITYVKGETEMVIQNVDKYRVCEPLFEGVRVVLAQLGEKYTPEYIQGISGAAFHIAGGCPSCPTCVYSMWTSDFVRYVGYEAEEYPCFDTEGNNISDKMIAAVKRQIDSGKPALVWHAFTNAEWDVVCGYDEEQKQFIGRGSYIGNDDYARESWSRAASCDFCPAFGAILLGEKKTRLDERYAEVNSLRNAVKHARTMTSPDECIEGIQFYKKWAKEYADGEKERDAADAYCHQIYLSARKAAVGYLREIAPAYTRDVSNCLLDAAKWFECETVCLSEASPYITWGSPWGFDQERNKKVAPILMDAADSYEKAVEYLEKALIIL